MTLFKLQLISKNNKRRGSYLYMPIVEDNGKYYFCESVKSSAVLNKKDVNISSIKVRREIPEQFYAANGIPIKSETA